MDNLIERMKNQMSQKTLDLIPEIVRQQRKNRNSESIDVAYYLKLQCETAKLEQLNKELEIEIEEDIAEVDELKKLLSGLEPGVSGFENKVKQQEPALKNGQLLSYKRVLKQSQASRMFDVTELEALSDEIKAIKSKTETLKKEMEQFDGLPPNVCAAKRHIEDLSREVDEMNSNLVASITDHVGKVILNK